ncbi:DUF393 domain-containing protein [Candidatus Kaiserbacteria bacterium]|nr:DUF393 domain-containing protein [Candidatus Kaiserbacteria bacterium]MCB9811543.1 DUF393 domain-containing protein [Candidatus Nomurabacteria bacterium]
MRLVLKNSREGMFTFIPIESEEGKALIKEGSLSINPEHPDSIAVLVSDEKVYYKWQGGVEIARHTTFPFRLVYFVAMMVPSFLGDRIYDCIGRHRALLCRLVRCRQRQS